MKTEHEFNKFLTKEIKLLGTSYKAVKTSDRFKVGLPDWIIIKNGRTVVAESKFIKTIPKKGLLLRHKVSGAQLTGLKSFTLAGANGFVLIGINSPTIKGMYIVNPEIFVDGNITMATLEVGALNEKAIFYPFNEVKRMIDAMIDDAVL